MWPDDSQIITDHENQYELLFHDKTGRVPLAVSAARADWSVEILKLISVKTGHRYTFQQTQTNHKNADLDDFNSCWHNAMFNKQCVSGLLSL